MTSLHAKTPEFRRLGLFVGIKSFSELERRIEALTDERQRGDAFEVFAEAYLATQRVGMAKHVWPDKAIPPSLRKRLRLSARDVGADGVIETVAGKYRGYQAKFRTGRTPLTWSEVSTFFGVTDHCDDRLLFTNSDDVSEITDERDKFLSIRGSDLDLLEAEDFEAIQAWLARKKVIRKKNPPREYQQQALDLILSALNQQDRATAVMACGTGKTFVALWVDMVAFLTPKRSKVDIVQAVSPLSSATTWQPHASPGHRPGARSQQPRGSPNGADLFVVRHRRSGVSCPSN